MPKRIDKLTPEQEARMASWADEWIEVGLSTEPIDVPRFSSACERLYGYAGIPWHGNVIVVPNPLVGALAAPIVASLLQGDTVHAAVRAAVGGAVADAVDAAVGGAVDGAVGGAVRAAVGGAVGGAVGRRSYPRYGGSLWPGWWAWRLYFRGVCGLELAGDLWDRAEAMAETIRSACWWWPHEKFVMVCDRPAVIRREQIGERGWGSHRLHCENGPAIAWRDGWSLWFIHGVQVTEQVVMHPETITWQDVLGEDNAERRRVMAERMGWDRLVTEAGLTLISEVEDPANAPHTLRLWDGLPADLYGEPVRLVTMVNASPDLDGSERIYGLTVPANISHAGEAIAWTFDMDWKDYSMMGAAC